MQKVTVNNKPLSNDDRTKIKRDERLKEKFGTVEDLMEYVEELEKRIDNLENM